MFDIVFVFLFFITFIACFFLLKISEGGINKINLVTVTVVAILLFGFLGVLPLFYGLDSYRYQSGVQDKGVLFEVFLLSNLSLFFLFVGIFIVRSCGIRNITFNNQNIKRLTFLQVLFLFLIFVCCLYSLYLYVNMLAGIALFSVFADGYEQAKVVRSNMGNAFKAGAHWYKLFLYDYMSILTFTAFAVFLRTKRRLHFFLFLLFSSVTAFILLMAIEKAPIIWFLVGLFFVYFIVKNNAAIPWRIIVILLGVATIFMVILFQLFYGADSIAEGLMLFVSRAFSGSVEPTYYYLEMFPEVVDHQYGATFPNPGGVFDFIPYRYTVEVANYVNPSLAGRGIVGSMPTVFWGEAYINWGVWGVLFVSFSVGVVVTLLDNILSSINVNSFAVGVYVWMILFIKDLSVTGFTSIFINLYLYAVIALLIILILLRGKIQFNKPVTAITDR